MPQLPALGSYIEVSDGTSAPTFDEIAYVESWSQDDPGTPEIPTTHLRSTKRERLYALPDDGPLNLVIFWDPDDATHEELRALRKSREERDWKLHLAESALVGSFTAPVTQFARNAGGPDAALKGTVQLGIKDGITWA